MTAEKAEAITRQRAEAVQQYLVSKGVPADRVLVKAYGNASPLNHCTPGVQCTAEEHAENRRVEYTVTSDGTR
jgi:outer membrane protein OmpA-like peptidoglycan-associated protein